MDKPVRKASNLTAIAMIAAAGGFIGVALIGAHVQPASGQYYQPPREPPRITPPFNNPISNPLDVTKVIPGQEGVINPAISALGQQIGGSAILGVQSISKFPGSEELKGPTDFILVQGENGADFQRETPYLVNLKEGTLLAAVKRPSSMGMIHTPIGQVAFGANSDAFVSYVNGALRVRNVDGMGQTIKVKITSGPLAGKTYSVQPGYELVVSDHKLTRTDLRPSDGILRRQSQLFDNGFAGVSQYHVHSALTQSGVVSSLNNKNNNNSFQRRVVGDMSRMAAVLNHVQGSAGYTSQ